MIKNVVFDAEATETAFRQNSDHGEEERVVQEELLIARPRLGIPRHAVGASTCPLQTNLSLNRNAAASPFSFGEASCIILQSLCHFKSSRGPAYRQSGTKFFKIRISADAAALRAILYELKTIILLIFCLLSLWTSPRRSTPYPKPARVLTLTAYPTLRLKVPLHAACRNVTFLTSMRLTGRRSLYLHAWRGKSVSISQAVPRLYKKDVVSMDVLSEHLIQPRTNLNNVFSSLEHRSSYHARRFCHSSRAR